MIKIKKFGSGDIKLDIIGGLLIVLLIFCLCLFGLFMFSLITNVVSYSDEHSKLHNKYSEEVYHSTGKTSYWITEYYFVIDTGKYKVTSKDIYDSHTIGKEYIFTIQHNSNFEDLIVGKKR